MTFMQELESFLLSLRDDYGFLMPVDRLRDCMICSSSIIDIEEVLYRMQSMVCSSQEQIETFQSLFAQKFLQKKPHDLSEAKRPKQLSPQTQYQRLQNQYDSMQRAAGTHTSQAQARQRRLSELIQQEQDVQENISRYKSVVLAIRESQPISKEAREAAEMAARPNFKDAKLRNQLTKVQHCMKELKKLYAKNPSRSKPLNPDRFREAVEKSLETSSFKLMLDYRIKEAMEAAAKARTSQDMAVFQVLLDTVSSLQKLQSAAVRSIGSSEKKELQAIQKESSDYEKRLAEAEEILTQSRIRLDSILLSQNKLTRQIKESEARAMQAARQADTIRKEIEQAKSAEGSIVVKEQALEHRLEFLGGIHSVQTTAAVAKLMKTDLKRMSAEEKASILSYIRTNARVFRQTLRRKSASSRKKQIDIKATMRLAGRTNGEPLKIRYKEPRKSHANVVILADISGSCRKVSELTLYFMAMMETAFPGGCRKFVFVNSLVPVDRQFRDSGPDEGVKAVIDTVPTRGIYSDYGATIEALRREYSGVFRKDTTVIILGDARNNARTPHDDDLKYIADRCRNVFWLNPDDPSKWNTGDSIVGIYERAGAKVFSVQTIGDLLNFLVTIKET